MCECLYIWWKYSVISSAEILKTYQSILVSSEEITKYKFVSYLEHVKHTDS